MVKGDSMPWDEYGKMEKNHVRVEYSLPEPKDTYLKFTMPESLERLIKEKYGKEIPKKDGSEDEVDLASELISLALQQNTQENQREDILAWLRNPESRKELGAYYSYLNNEKAPKVKREIVSKVYRNDDLNSLRERMLNRILFIRSLYTTDFTDESVDLPKIEFPNVKISADGYGLKFTIDEEDQLRLDPFSIADLLAISGNDLMLSGGYASGKTEFAKIHFIMNGVPNPNALRIQADKDITRGDITNSGWDPETGEVIGATGIILPTIVDEINRMPGFAQDLLLTILAERLLKDGEFRRLYGDWAILTTKNANEDFNEGTFSTISALESRLTEVPFYNQGNHREQMVKKRLQGELMEKLKPISNEFEDLLNEIVELNKRGEGDLEMYIRKGLDDIRKKTFKAIDEVPGLKDVLSIINTLWGKEYSSLEEAISIDKEELLSLSQHAINEGDIGLETIYKFGDALSNAHSSKSSGIYDLDQLLREYFKNPLSAREMDVATNYATMLSILKGENEVSKETAIDALSIVAYKFFDKSKPLRKDMTLQHSKVDDPMGYNRLRTVITNIVSKL